MPKDNRKRVHTLEEIGLWKKGKAVLFWVEDNLDDGKGISTLSSTDQNLKKQRHYVEPHKTST